MRMNPPQAPPNPASDTDITSDMNSVSNTVSHAQKEYLKTLKHHRFLVTFFRIFILVCFLGLWEITSRCGVIDSFIFSSPTGILTCFVEMASDGTIFRHIGITVYETLTSFLLVLIFSILFAVLLWFSAKASEILDPYLVVLNSLPKSALAPLLIVWLGANQKTIIVAGMSVAIFGSILNLYTSFKEVDPEEIKLIYTLRGNKFHALTKVVLPSSIPSIISNMKVNIGLCLVGVIIGEFIGAKEGLGYLIIYSSQVFKLNWLLMSIVILCIIAMALYSLISLVEKLYQRHIYK